MRIAVASLTLLVALELAARAHRVEDVDLPDRLELADTTLLLNGASLYEATIFAIDIFVIALYLETRTRDSRAASSCTRPLAIDYLSISEYEGIGGASVRIERDLDLDIRGKHVLLVEDIVNTGLTMDYVLKTLRARQPASLRVCALFDKGERRLVPVSLDYIGFSIPNEFVVGYGLDYRELYRNLPFLCVLKPEVYRIEDVAASPVAVEAL